MPPRQFLVFRLWLWQAAHVAVPQCLKKWSEAPTILLIFSWKLLANMVDTGDPHWEPLLPKTVDFDGWCSEAPKWFLSLAFKASVVLLSVSCGFFPKPHGNPFHPLPNGILQQSAPSDILVQKRSLQQHRRNRAFHRSFHLRSFSVLPRNRTCGS